MLRRTLSTPQSGSIARTKWLRFLVMAAAAAALHCIMKIFSQLWTSSNALKKQMNRIWVLISYSKVIFKIIHLRFQNYFAISICQNENQNNNKIQEKAVKIERIDPHSKIKDVALFSCVFLLCYIIPKSYVFSKAIIWISSYQERVRNL